MKTPSLIKSWQAWIVFIFDLLAVASAWFVVNALYFKHWKPEPFLFQLLLIIIAFSLSFKLCRTYAAMWRSISQQDLRQIVYAVGMGSVVFYLLIFMINRMEGVPRTNIVFFPILALMFILSGRFIYRQWRGYRVRHKSPIAQNIIVVGAGAGGDLFVREYQNLNNGSKIIAILDDNKQMHGKRLRGVHIGGDTTLLSNKQFLQKYQIKEVVIAIPSLPSQALQVMLEKISDPNVKVKVLPSLLDLTSGAKVTDLREVSIEDLLGRDPIQVNLTKLKGAYDDQVILVTGGGGSIGSELCRQLLNASQPKTLLILDHSEYNLYMITQELKQSSVVVGLIGSVTDAEFMQSVFDQYSIDVVFHAAAYKHVPMLEYQVKQAIKNNLIGTQTVVDLAVQYQVKRFILVSTDKAVNPTNVMGATKRLCELYVQKNIPSQTAFITTRFGNVLGSAGSVIPLFKQQIEKGGPVTVTDPKIERYFMTIPEASQLVILAGAVGMGNDTFVLDMGEPVKIIDLAENLIRLSGRKPYVDIDIQFTGLRRGEKMYEELFYQKESLQITPYNKLMRGESKHVCADEIAEDLEKLYASSDDSKLLFKLIEKYADNSKGV